MTKLLWHSNAPWAPTGYGQQTGLFLPHLKDHYEVACSSFFGLEGSPIKWDGIPVLPGMTGTYGDEHLVQHAARFFGGDPRGGLVVTLLDVWVMDPQWLSRLNAACWVPIDHDPAPPKVVEVLVQSSAIPIAMSRFGERMLGRLDPLYVPHAVDTDVYRPIENARAALNLGDRLPEDAFLVGMVAANKGRPSRKGFSQAFQAFAKFAAEHDNAYLYLHTMIDPALAGGENIPAMLEACGVPVDRVMKADQYRVLFDPYPPETMAAVFSTMDVLLNPAMGEGFGIPVLEAQSCGVPAIVTDHSAMTEVCGAGWHVKPAARYFTGLSSWQVIPDVDDIVAALEECYAMPAGQRRKLSDSARRHACSYDVHRVLKMHMLPTLERMRQRYELQQPVTISPRLKAAA